MSARECVAPLHTLATDWLQASSGHVQMACAADQLMAYARASRWSRLGTLAATVRMQAFSGLQNCGVCEFTCANLTQREL